ncbi:MAG: CynX/NimT family MFS transporter [Solimonas sp.]
MRRQWWVLAAVTLSFFFLNAATFTSLGVALYSMLAELHWSQTAAGFSFTLLGLACGLSSPLPAALMKRIGVRWTVALGGVTLAVGFLLAFSTHGLVSFYIAMLLLGIGYSLAGNVPGIYAIATWFPDSSARMIGVYLMGGAFGAVVGPTLVQTIVALSGSWRIHWLTMAFVAAAIGLVCYACIRDAEGTFGAERAPRAEAAGDWTYWDAILTPQFLLVALSMALTMACVTTIHSVAVTHLTHLGSSQAFAAFMLSMMALVTTLAKGAAGPMCERLPSRLLLAGGLLLQALGVVLFAGASTPALVYAFALVFGLGWGFAYLAASVLLLEYFGRETGSQVLSVVWLLTTVAAAGPLAAGAIADRFDTFAPIFYVYAGLLLVAALPIALMQPPQPALRPAHA